jgi:hypothetical protein
VGVVGTVVVVGGGSGVGQGRVRRLVVRSQVLVMMLGHQLGGVVLPTCKELRPRDHDNGERRRRRKGKERGVRRGATISS